MGPITILDKSAFQALSAREHIFVFKHLYVNVTPVLVFEVLGDLTKKVATGRRAMDEVQTLARKFGGSGGPVNETYLVLARADLLGGQVPMTGQIIPDNWTRSGSGVVIDLSPLNEAILRWSDGVFSETEGQLSALWRNLSRSLSISTLGDHLRQARVILPRPDDEGQIIRVADQLLGTLALQDVWLEWALQQFVPDPSDRDRARARWATSPRAFLADYAPYAAHCLRCLLGLVIAERHRVLADRATHTVDLQYLYYLPFCHVLASDDRVHRLLGPQLLRPDQSFVTGQDLKAGLRAVADEWDRLDEGERSRRSYALGSYPPPVDPPVLYELWRRHMREWDGARPSGNLAGAITQKEAGLAMAEARRLMQRGEQS